jgi:hypothetical protein
MLLEFGMLLPMRPHITAICSLEACNVIFSTVAIGFEVEKSSIGITRSEPN